MSIIIKEKSIATTGRPTEYVGTIALDSVTAGQSMEDFIEKLVPTFIKKGYRFNGLRIYTGHPHDLKSNKKMLVYILLSKTQNNINVENIIVEREIDLLEVLTSLTAISIQFTSKTDFENDSIDWSSLKNLEE